MKCKICKHNAKEFSQAQVLNKYTAKYYHCEDCGFVQTDEPYWLDEAYSEAIGASDVGLVDRNIKFSKITNAVINTFFDQNSRFLDYGGGYGLFVRLMRDFGVNFYRYDRYCDNLFAKGFDADSEDNTRFDLVTAFEVFEHLTHPMDEIKQMLGYSRNIFFSTLLLPSNVPKPGGWWYYSIETGQHIAFYSLKTLEFMSRSFKLNLYTDGKLLHMVTEKHLPRRMFKLVTRYKIARLLSLFYKRKTLMPRDYHRAIIVNQDSRQLTRPCAGDSPNGPGKTGESRRNA